MDYALALLPGALMVGAVAPIVHRIQRMRTAERDAVRYLEALLVEARLCTGAAAAARI